MAQEEDILLRAQVRTKILYDTIEELVEAVQHGDINDELLEFTIDIDHEEIYVNEIPYPQRGGDGFTRRVNVKDGMGTLDINRLYQILFPKATIRVV